VLEARQPPDGDVAAEEAATVAVPARPVGQIGADRHWKADRASKASIPGAGGFKSEGIR
jgi:hypothetical protein